MHIYAYVVSYDMTIVTQYKRIKQDIFSDKKHII